jgi:hypothetical protein
MLQALQVLQAQQRTMGTSWCPMLGRPALGRPMV